MELKQHILKKKFDNVRSDVKKLNGKTKQVWFGIKQIEENIENV